jgi:hypothetical protein
LIWRLSLKIITPLLGHSIAYGKKDNSICGEKDYINGE